MIAAKADVLIFQKVEQVYRFVAVDLIANYPRWSAEVMELTPLSSGPVQPGFRARQVRVDKGHKTESIFEVTDMDPLKRICFKGVTAGYLCLYEFENLSPSTHLTFTFELHQIEGRMRPFEKLIRIALQDGAKQTVRKLKLLIEKEMLENG